MSAAIAPSDQQPSTDGRFLPKNPLPRRTRRERVGRERSGLVLFIAAMIFAVVATGCTGAVRDPTKYGDVNAKGEGFYGNLMYGCTGVLPDADGNYVDETLSSSEYCKCLFEGLKDRVPFDDVKEFETAQAEAKPGREPDVPKGIATVQEQCSKEHPALD